MVTQTDKSTPKPASPPAPPRVLVRRYLELIRFSHTVFALPFALFAAVLAWREPDSVFRLRDAVGIVLCMVLARASAMAFNRIVDRDIDGRNERTAGRHLPAGLLTLKSVVGFTVLTSVGFIAATLIFLPKQLPLLLAVPVLAWLLGYSYAKRWTSLCHYWLSFALMMSPVAAWIAIRDEFHIVPAILGGVVFFWVGGFDILYACQDAQFDRGNRLYSIPSRLGIRASLRIAAISHLLAIAMLFALLFVAQLGWVFLAGSVLIAALLVYEHSLVREDNLSKVNIAFFNVNAIISFGILLFGCLDVWLIDA